MPEHDTASLRAAGLVVAAVILVALITGWYDDAIHSHGHAGLNAVRYALALLSLSCLICGIIGLVNPRRVLPARWVPNRIKVAGLYFGLAVLGEVTVFQIASALEQQQQRTVTEQKRREEVERAQAAEQHRKQQAFDATPEGRRLATARKKEEAAKAAERAVLEAKARRVLRDQMAKHIENAMLDEGFNVDVSARGPDHTVLHLKWALVSKVVAHQLAKGDFLEDARALGFRRVEITDGFDETWYWNLRPPQSSKASQ